MGRNWKETIGKLLAPPILVGFLFLGARACTSEVLAPETPAEFAPLELLQLEVSPEELRPGDVITLVDGICNVTDSPVAAQIYLGAQSEGLTTFGTRTVDLLTRLNADGTRSPVIDTQEGRLPQVFEPGCTIQEPIRTVVPVALTPGLTWRLKAHIVVVGPSGEVQNITKTSNAFRVVEP